MFEEQIISIFGGFGVWAVVFVCSALPLIEARIAIPLGCATTIWGSGAMSVWGATLVAFIGSTVVGVLIVLLLTPTMRLLKRSKKLNKLVVGIENFFQQKLVSTNGKSKKKTIILLTTLIALPIPLMGMYSGAGVCAFLKLKWWQSVLCVVAGNLIGCILIALLCSLLYEFIPMLLSMMIILLVLVLIYSIISWIFGLKFKKTTKNS